MKPLRLIFFFGALFPLLSAAQEQPVWVSKNFRFADGVYFSHQSFRNNAPDLLWEGVEAKWHTNPRTFLTQLEYMRPIAGGDGLEDIAPDSIWGFSIQGIPYVRLSREWIDKELATFAPLELRGKICYFDFERIDTLEVLMTAYNPATGRPFRRGYVGKEMEVTYKKILDFETGEIKDLSRANLLAWIKDDPELTTAVVELPEEELDAKLFKCLLIYVDRNKVYIP